MDNAPEAFLTLHDEQMTACPGRNIQPSEGEGYHCEGCGWTAMPTYGPPYGPPIGKPPVKENDPRAISLAADFMARFGDCMGDLNEDVMALWFDAAIKQATNGRVPDPAPRADGDPVGSPPHWNV